MSQRAGVILATVLLPAFAVAVAQQDEAKQEGDRKGAERSGGTAPPERTGVAIGEKAPAFTLKDQAGKERQLDVWLKNGTIALIFYRSASW